MESHGKIRRGEGGGADIFPPNMESHEKMGGGGRREGGSISPSNMESHGLSLLHEAFSIIFPKNIFPCDSNFLSTSLNDSAN